MCYNNYNDYNFIIGDNMIHNYPFLSSQLKKNNIRPTHQRLVILDYLYNNFNHPSVLEIYTSLKKQILQ